MDGVKSFNDTCALLYTHLGTGATSGTHYNAGTSAYCSDYSKPSSATANTTTPTRYSETGYTKAEFADGTALTTLGTTNYAKLAGLNNGYPVFTWQTSAPLTNANTYYVANGSLTLALDNAGYVSLAITPLGDSATVNGKTITEAGTYTFTADATEEISVTGQALITIDLMNQRAGSEITALEATAIKAQIPDDADRIVVLVLYAQDGTLEEVVYENAELVGETVSAIINLSDIDVTGCTLKAFVWEQGTLTPIDGSPYTL